METSPALPVNHGDTIQLSCQTGYSLAGSDSATCIHGVSTVQISPVCFGKFAKKRRTLTGHRRERKQKDRNSFVVMALEIPVLAGSSFSAKYQP